MAGISDVPEEKSRFTLRISKDLMQLVKESAKENKRSAAMEIEYALDVYYYFKLYNKQMSAEEFNKKFEQYFNSKSF